ncbi:MAG: hypothetical protein U0271_14680 [Polyangiaceae bacterium]
MLRLHTALAFASTILLIGCGDDTNVGGSGGTGGATGGGGGGPAPFTCTFDEPLPSCGAACPIASAGSVTCNGYVSPAIDTDPSGEPALVLGAGATEDALAVDTVARTLTPLFPVQSRLALTANDDGALHLFDGAGDNGEAWVHHTVPTSGPPGTEEVITSQSGGYIVPYGAVARSGKLTALGLAGTSTTEDLILANQLGDGSWETSLLGLDHPVNPTLAFADDGTPLIGFFSSATGEWHFNIKAGDLVPVDLGFSFGTGLSTGGSIAGGPTSWKAAAFQLAAGIHIIHPGVGQDDLDGTAPLSFQSCAASAGGGACSGTCTESATGAAPGVVVLSTEGQGVIVAYVEAVIDRTYNLVEGECTEAGCPCEAVLTDDQSSMSLVLYRHDNGIAAEAYRLPITAPPSAVPTTSLVGAQRDSDASLAWVDATGESVGYAHIDLSLAIQ